MNFVDPKGEIAVLPIIALAVYLVIAHADIANAPRDVTDIQQSTGTVKDMTLDAVMQTMPIGFGLSIISKACPILAKGGKLALGRFGKSGEYLSELEAFAQKYGARILKEPPPSGVSLDDYIKAEIDKADEIFFRMKEVKPKTYSYDVELPYIKSNPALGSKTKFYYDE